VEWKKEPFDTWWGRLRDALRADSGATQTLPVIEPNHPYELPVIASAPAACTDDTWQPTVPPYVSARAFHTAVWTGSEMIVWGGSNAPFLNTGGRYNPATDTWTATTTANAPSPRQFHTAVWTGSEMIVWGGGVVFGPSFNTGGRYDPVT